MARVWQASANQARPRGSPARAPVLPRFQAAVVVRDGCRSPERGVPPASAHGENMSDYAADIAKYTAQVDAKAVETLKALLANPDFEAFPEYEKARQLLARLGGSA